MIWSKKQMFFLANFCRSQVISQTFDVVTDFITALTLLYDEDKYLYDFGIVMMAFIFLPCIWSGLIAGSGISKLTTKLKRMLKGLIVELPGMNCIRQLSYLLELCFMNTDNPHNFLLMNQIQARSIASGFKEAFLEAMPQVIAQNFVVTHKLTNKLGENMYTTIVSLLLSIYTSSMSSMRVFLLQRNSYYSDIQAPAKMLVIVLPLIILVTICMGLLWSLTFYTGPIALGCFAVYLLISYSLFRKCKMHVSTQMLGQMGIHPTVVAWMVPFSPQTQGKKCDLLLSILKIIASLGFPIFFMSYLFFMVGDASFFHFLIGSVSIVFVTSIALYFLGDYNKLMKFTNLVCCKKPVIHRSVIFDFLAGLEKSSEDLESDPDFPHFFNLFTDDADNLHKPELEFGDTVLHFAAKKNQLRALLNMIQKGGNPFIKNLQGETAESIVLNIHAGANDNERNEVLKAIESYHEKFPPKPRDSLVHSAARENRLVKLKVMKFFGANFESYNEWRQLPLDVAIAEKHLELSLYLMLETNQLYNDKALSKNCFQFLIVQASESLFTKQLTRKYLKVFKKCFKVQKLAPADVKANMRQIKMTLFKKLSQEELNKVLLDLLLRSFSQS